MIVEAALLGLKLFGLLFVMLVCHEIGHYAYFADVLKRKVKIRFKRSGIGLKVLVGQESDYIGLNHKQLAGIYVSGVIAGFIPWFVVMMFTNWSLLYLMMLLPYAWGSMPDIVRSIDNMKNNNWI